MSNNIKAFLITFCIFLCLISVAILMVYAPITLVFILCLSAFLGVFSIVKYEIEARFE